MSQALAFVLSGLVAGALYAVMASGLVLCYASSRIFNFAQGAIGFVAAVLFYELHSGLHWPVVPAAVVTVGIAAPLLGWGLHRLMFARLTRAGESAQIVATIGLLVALPALALGLVELLTGPFGLRLPAPVNVVAPPGLGPSPKVFWEPLPGVSLDSDQLVTFAGASLCAVGLWLLLTRTRTGLGMRATADRRELAALRGIAPDRASALAWALSSALAGLVGVLAAPIYGLDATSYTLLLLISATAAVFGRFQSIPVTFGAGLLLGVVQNLVAGYSDFAKDITGFRNAVPVVILLGGLLLFNRERGRVAGTINDDAPPPDHLADLPRWRRALPWATATAVLLGYLFAVADAFWAGIIAQGLALSVIFLSFTLVTGLGGMVSFAQATFVVAAALTTGMLYAHGIPLGVAVLAGVAGAVLAGVVIALPALRLGGRVLALATLALALVGEQVVFQIAAFNNRTLGWELPAVAVGPFDLADGRTMAVFLLAVVALIVLLIRNLERSSTGRAMLAVRAGPAAAATSGVSSVRTKLLLFSLSAAVAGLGGILYALFQGRIAAGDFPAAAGFMWLAVVVLFGVRRPAAAVVAGVVTAVMPQLFSEYVSDSPYIPAILFGLGGLGLAQQPDGVLTQFAEARHARRRRAGPRTERGAERGAETAVTERAAPPEPRERQAASRGDERPLLELDGVSAGYEQVTVLRDVHLTVSQGQAVALLGANGAGKSTLCRVASGLLVPGSGRLRAAGEDVTGRPPERLARAGVFAAPEGRGVFPGLTVEENLATWLAHRDERAQVYDRFPRLAERRGAPAGVLSGGEQQLLTLAPMLVRPPRLAVVDEPSLGLAPRVVDEVFALFAELRDRGTSLLIAEEKAADVLEIADLVVFMRVGRIVWSGPRDQVDQDALTEAYLGLGSGTGGVGEVIDA